jgi:hypothetical protein
MELRSQNPVAADGISATNDCLDGHVVWIMRS